MTFLSPPEAQAPVYSNYSQDPNATPPPHHFEATRVEEDLVYISTTHLSQREALVVLEQEAKQRHLEEERRKPLARDRLMSDNPKMFGL